MKPAKVQLIHPPIRIIGRTLVIVPFSISKAMFGSEWGTKWSVVLVIWNQEFLLLTSH